MHTILYMHYSTQSSCSIQGELLKTHSGELETSYGQLQGLKSAKACCCSSLAFRGDVYFSYLGRCVMISCMLPPSLLDSDCASSGKTRLAQPVSARSRRKPRRTATLHMLGGIGCSFWVALGPTLRLPRGLPGKTGFLHGGNVESDCLKQPRSPSVQIL